MRMFAVAMLIAVLAMPVVADEPKMPVPQKEHEWLKQLIGEWDCESEMVMPGQPAIKAKRTEVTRSVGGFWAVSDMKSVCMGVTMTGQMTVGYDAAKKKYIGTFFCSMSDTLWKYEGTLDASGKILTLETEGPCPMTGKTVKMKDVLEVKDKDTKVLTSFSQGEDGKWIQFMTLNAKRKK